MLQKVESSSTFATKSVHVARFTGPRQTCFATSDVTPVYGVSPAKFYPIKSQYSRNLQQPDLLRDRFDSWVVKRATSLFHSLGSNVAKQVARFCCPVGLKYTLVLCDPKYFHLHQLCASMSVCHLYINGNQTEYYNQGVNFPSADCLHSQKEDNLQNREGSTEFSSWISRHQIGEAPKNCPNKTKIYYNQ